LVPALPRINDGALLFLQHMIAKMRAPKEGGSRIGIVFNGSPLFTGDAGGGESEIRRWIIENDWLEAVVALPEQLFYNTGISTYIWVLTNRKEKRPQGQGAAHRRPQRSGCRWKKPGQQAPPHRRPQRQTQGPRLHRRHHQACTADFEEGASRWVLFDKDGKVVTVTASAPTAICPGRPDMEATRGQQGLR
jgi:type I restriction enzyme M protein